MPKNAVYVGRPGKFGNPFNLTRDRTAAEVVSAFEQWLTLDHVTAGIPEKKATILNSMHELKGKDLVCWCRAGSPCHANVLLKIANQDPKPTKTTGIEELYEKFGKETVDIVRRELTAEKGEMPNYFELLAELYLRQGPV
jgi:hypothetical protein